MSESTPDGLTVIRPTSAARLKLWLPGVIAFPFLLLLALLELFTAVWLSIAIAVLAVVLLVVSIAQARIMRLELGGGRYRFRSLLRRRDFAVADVRGVHTFTALSQSLYTFADLMVEGQDGRRLMRMPSLVWDVSILAFVAQDLESHGAPLVVTQLPVSAAQVRAAHPRLVSWFEANQLLAAVLVGIGALVLGIIVIAVVVVVLASGVS